MYKGENNHFNLVCVQKKHTTSWYIKAKSRLGISDVIMSSVECLLNDQLQIIECCSLNELEFCVWKQITFKD